MYVVHFCTAYQSYNLMVSTALRSCCKANEPNRSPLGHELFGEPLAFGRFPLFCVCRSVFYRVKSSD